MVQPNESKPPRTLGWLLAALGVALTLGGAWLITKGASPYFLLVGLGVATSGALLANAKKAALAAYGVTLAIIVIGSFLEEGMNVSALTPRLALPLIIGVYLAQPQVRATLS